MRKLITTKENQDHRVTLRGWDPNKDVPFKERWLIRLGIHKPINLRSDDPRSPWTHFYQRPMVEIEDPYTGGKIDISPVRASKVEASGKTPLPWSDLSLEEMKKRADNLREELPRLEKQIQRLEDTRIFW